MTRPLQPAAWPFTKINFTPSPRLPSMDIEPLDLTEAAIQGKSPGSPRVCMVCGGMRERPAADGSEARPCAVCDGQGEIGGGA